MSLRKNLILSCVRSAPVDGRSVSIQAGRALAFICNYIKLDGRRLPDAFLSMQMHRLSELHMSPTRQAWVHAANGWVFTAANGGREYPAFLIVASVVQALLSDGAYALSRSAPLPRLSSAAA
jgi:hypothetical protein